MSSTVQQLADLIGGIVVGDGSLPIHAARTLREAQAGQITVVENPRHAPLLKACQASAAVVSTAWTGDPRTLIQVNDPLNAFIALVRHFHGIPEVTPIGIDVRVAVHPSASVGEGCNFYPFVSVGEGSVIGARCTFHSSVSIGRFCTIGDDVLIYPNAVLYDGTVVGDRCIVHANAVLGADGFGYRPVEGRHVKVPQLGHVEIGADVEVGACTCIDRGTFQATRIGEGTKFDNLVQIGHNCQIGRHNLLVGQTGIGGSCTTGDYVVIAGQAGVADHVHLGDQVVVGAKSAVSRDVPAGERMLGIPATPEREQKRIISSLTRLPEIRHDLRRVKRQLGLHDEEKAA